MQETSLRARILPRVFVFLKIASILFCLGHFVFSVIFFAQNAYFFGVYNILSTIFYAVLCVSMSTLTADNVRRVSCVLTHMIIELKLLVGVADFEDGDDIEELIKVADDRLYMGKKTWKNKIVYKE